MRLSLLLPLLLSLVAIDGMAKWEYPTENDRMGRGITHYAENKSLNSVVFAFPYNGGSSAELNLMNCPKSGKQAYIWITKGQFDCRYNGCTLLFKFDGGKPIKWHANQADSGRSDAVFLSNYSKLVELLRKTKKLQVEAPFWRDGDHVFEFDVSNLEWK